MDRLLECVATDGNLHGRLGATECICGVDDLGATGRVVMLIAWLAGSCHGWCQHKDDELDKFAWEERLGLAMAGLILKLLLGCLVLPLMA